MEEVSAEVRQLVGQLDFDQAELARRYAYERDVRLRPDRNNQYIETEKEFSHYADDPYAEPLVRAAVEGHTDVIVVGGGIGGLVTASYLHDAGVDDVRIIEKGGDFGGTWYWNRYPGLRCDVESYVYMPLLERFGGFPTEKYSRGSEILDHLRKIARKLNLYDKALLQTQVMGLKWDKDAALWRVETDRGDKVTAKFVIMANGLLVKPKLPGIPGIEDFKGHTFHTSRWDYDYTGGSQNSALVNLADKRVGIVGTGATAVQVVPEVGSVAKELYVFQRTPAAVDYRYNRPTDVAWAGNLAPGWQDDRVVNFHAVAGGLIDGPDLVKDGWTEIGKLQDSTASWAAKKIGRPLNSAEAEFVTNALDDLKMNHLRARIDAEVKDPATAEALKPWHRRWCKRPSFSDEYLQTFNRPNVSIVDTAGKGIERMTANGVVAGGKEYELDCLIFATGYEVGTEYTRRAGYDVIGRDGVELGQYWHNGMRTYQGIFIHGFPNLFMCGWGQSAGTFSVTFMLSEQAKHIAFVLKTCLDRGLRTVEPSAEAVEDYVLSVRPLSISQRKFWQDCTPSYFTTEGDTANPHGMFANIPPVGPIQFYQDLEAWRARGDLKGLELA
ncbi:monooxygenase [Tardibacter chloracetimidivorans]|uniref:Monooxygenase n=1 Tax=Tardibacter chloracetimidivorans TaxID=1921510 RepID=A0A1L3ZSN2_9SPHN|nr:NAD(P)/FAD-dependent oxidoreductase [Tardibacter chloracetimidivorans]API58634.1 monooxygenase [Tardibacter chloracetimidivorans]